MSKAREQFCGSPEHSIDRRLFLQGGIATALGVGMAGLEAPLHSLHAAELKQEKKQVLMIWLAGGASQLEMWDPKPGRAVGGPFRSIPTAVPGTHVCELMPRVASILNRMAVVRSIDTKIADHGQAAELVQRGRRGDVSVPYPDIGAVIAKELGERDSAVPEYVSLYVATEGQRSGRPEAGFLGGRYGGMSLERSLKPENIALPESLTERDHTEREHLRQYLTERFNRGRNAEEVEGYNNSYARVRGLMRSDSLFDLERESPAMRDRYGRTDFGQHALIGRRLLEAGVPMVKVSRAWWDTHSDNFESNRELVTEFDRVFSTLLLDLEDRGLLKTTLVVILSEFGRTPAINKDLGRDHFASAWSCAFAGCGIKGGALYGKTDEDCKTVVDGKVGAGDIAATIYTAVGIKPKKTYRLGSRPIPLAPEDSKPIAAILS